MSAAPTRRIVPVLAISFASLLLLAGCVGQRDPDKWTDDAKERFVAACDGTAAKDEPIDEIREDLEAIAKPTETCQCVIDHLEENMPFSDYKAANSKRRDETDERTPLRDSGFVEAYEACGVGDIDVIDDGSDDGDDPADDSSDDSSDESTDESGDAVDDD